MSESGTAGVEKGWRVIDDEEREIGSVDGVFVDYLLVRTRSLLPVDLYIPSNAITLAGDGRVAVDGSVDEARMRWGRPLRRAPHDHG
jgi:hypothetical protein